MVVPTRGRRGFLAAAVESVLEQSRPDFELLIVDDEPEGGGTMELPGDPRIRRSASGGVGAAAARNRGIAAARAELVAFLDDDDLWAPRKLELQLAALAAHPECELVFCAMEKIVDETGERIPAKPTRELALVDLLRATPFGCSPVVVRRSALCAVGGFDEELEATHDRDLWLRLRQRAPFARVDEPLGTVRLHGEQMSSDLPRKISARRKILAKHAEDYRRHPRALALQLARLGMMEQVAGWPWRAVGRYLTALRHDPFSWPAARLLAEALLASGRQRRRLVAEVFGRRPGIVHYW